MLQVVRRVVRYFLNETSHHSQGYKATGWISVKMASQQKLRNITTEFYTALIINLLYTLQFSFIIGEKGHFNPFPTLFQVLKCSKFKIDTF